MSNDENQSIERLSIDDILPYGDMIRPLIASSLLTRTDLKELLFKRGIYTGSSEKSITIPILSSTLLTPNEFEILKLKQTTKENTPKFVSRELIYDSDKSLFDVVKEDLISIRDIVGNNATNYKIIKSTPFTPINQDKNNLELEYIIERTDPTKDFFNSTSRYEGRINLQLDKDQNKLQVLLESTAPETKSLNELLYKETVLNLERKNYIKKDKEQKITFGEFNNEERIKFLLSLQGIDRLKIFEFDEVTSFEVSFDEKVSLPQEIDWMDKKVKNMILKGEQLHDTEILKNSKFHSCLLVSSVVANYSFSSRDSKGECTLEYGFFSRKRIPYPNTEFEFKITKLVVDSNHTTKSEYKVKRFLLSLFNKFKNEKYNEIKGEI
ncbi:hypothetical protein ACFSCX_20515 [Bacillus salitolerans]|uniref:GAPS4b N-terminal domain-containing protein n=1 Tax=Bacillus salitolerans TaxID=1437434 RepID=A0ABW4LV30_9BACI